MKSSKELIEYEVLKAKKFKNAMGLKMVRGAYSVFETKHSKENNIEYPICDSFEHTTQMISHNI